MKFEKITLWTCTETYDKPKESGGLTALDYIIPALDEAQSQHIEFRLLDYDSEDYALVPFPTLEQDDVTVKEEISAEERAITRRIKVLDRMPKWSG